MCATQVWGKVGDKWHSLLPSFMKWKAHGLVVLPVATAVLVPLRSPLATTDVLDSLSVISVRISPVAPGSPLFSYETP